MLKKYVIYLYLVSLVFVVGCSDNSERRSTESEATQQASDTINSEISPQSAENESLAKQQINDCSVTMGWDPWEPYHYQDVDNQVRGLDVELVQAVVSSLNCQLKFERNDWSTLLTMLQTGEIDILTGASKTKQREGFAYFTQPYRREAFALFGRQDDVEKYQNLELSDLLSKGFKLGVTTDYVYTDEINQYQDDPKYKDQFQSSLLSEVNLSKLINSEIDGFLEDKYVGATILRRKGTLAERVEAFPITLPAKDVYIMLSQASLKSDFLEQFDAKLTLLKQQGNLDTILNKYLEN